MADEGTEPGEVGGERVRGEAERIGCRMGTGAEERDLSDAYEMSDLEKNGKKENYGQT